MALGCLTGPSVTHRGSTTHNVVLGLGKELGIKAVPTSTGGMPATLTAVMSGRIDIGWGSPPFGRSRTKS